MARGHLHESWLLFCGMKLKKEKNMAILCVLTMITLGQYYVDFLPTQAQA